jgi:hypothetical protein
MSAPQAGPTTRFGRLERRGVLLGLSGPQLAVIGAAAVVAVSGVYSAGAGGLVASAPVWGLLLAAGTLTVGGRPVVGWVPLLTAWCVRRLVGATTQAASTHRRGGDVVVLPGFAGRVQLVDCVPLGGVLVVDRRAGTATGVLRVAGSGFVLDEPGMQEAKVAGWGRVLAAAGQQPALVRLQVLARTVPGGLAPARRWWREHCANARGPVLQALAGMLDEGFVVPARRETLLAVAVRTPGRRAWANGDGLGLVARHLNAVAASLAGADLTPEVWLDREELTGALRGAFDPQATARAADGPVRLAGQVGVREGWRSLTTGGAVHATYWVSEWPRATTHPGFLQPLLLGQTDTRTLSVLAEPVATRQALREIRRAKVEHVADAAQRTRIGQMEDEATRAEVADLERREAELVAGHGDLRFTGLLTVSADDETQLEARCAAMETAAAQAMCEVRRLVGQQGVAFLAAALPLARGVL